MDAASVNERPRSVLNWIQATYTSKTELVERTRVDKSCQRKQRELQRNDRDKRDVDIVLHRVSNKLAFLGWLQ